MTTTQQLRIGSSSRVLRVDVDQLPRAKQVRRLFSILSRRPPITKLVSMYQRASCAKHSRPSASLELPAQSMRTRRACRLQAARRACLLPRSSTNSSKNNLTVWAAVGGRRRGIYSLYRALQPTPPDSGESKCVANHVDVQRCSRGVFHRMPPLLRLGLDRAHADLNLGALSHFCIPKRLSMSASNIRAKRGALRTTRMFDGCNNVHFTTYHFYSDTDPTKTFTFRAQSAPAAERSPDRPPGSRETRCVAKHEAVL